MWKDTDLYAKRDDDSAIGDSENNSAEEESMNSRRKSSISDDIDEMSVDPQAQLLSKLDKKIPDCLLKSSDELIENCRKIQISYASSKPKPKREIRVLPSATAVVSRKVSTDATKTSMKGNTSLLQAKFQHLLSEMKKLRELDQEILKKFLALNETVEEVRWKLTENEKDLRRKIAEEQLEEDFCSFSCEQRTSNSDDVTDANNYVNLEVTKAADNDVTSSLNHENYDMTKKTKVYKNVIAVPSFETVDGVMAKNSSPLQLRNNTISMQASMNKIVPNGQLGRSPNSNPPVSTIAHQPSSIRSSPTLADAEICDWSLHSPEQEHTSKRNAANLNKDLSNRNNQSDVWVVRDNYETTRIERSNRKIGSRNSIAVAPLRVGNVQSTPNPGSAIPRRRKSEITHPQLRGRSNLGACSFRMVADENSRIGRLGQWTATEQRGSMQPKNLQNQSSNHHHISLSSRLRGPGSIFHLGNTKPSDSSSSLNSSSSRTSSESSTSAPPPPSNALKRSNSSSKWGKLFRRTSKTGNSALDKKANGVPINNNYKPAPLTTKRISDPILSDANVMPVSYKRTPDSTHRWTHHHDDITYL